MLTSRQMERLLEGVFAIFSVWSDRLEFTAGEAEPGDNREKLAVMKERGVICLSFRRNLPTGSVVRDRWDHGVDEIADSVEAAREAGIDNVSLDLMFGLPQQSVADMEEALVRGWASAALFFRFTVLKVEGGMLLL